MNIRSHVAGSLLALAAIMTLACNSDRATAPDSRSIQSSRPSADLAGLASSSSLYIEPSTNSSTQSFAYFGHVTYTADDFIVPDTATWTIAQVGFTGFLHATELAFSIRKDNNGVPGAIVPTTDVSLAPSATEQVVPGLSNFLFTLPTPVTLAPGKYWLVAISSNLNADNVFDREMAGITNSPGLGSTDDGVSWFSAGNDFSFGVFGSARFQQTITIAPTTPNPAPLGSATTVSASTSSGLDVALTVSPASVCTLAGATLSFVGLGKCTVTANQAGNATYFAAPQVTEDIVVVTVPQTISFPAITPNPATVLSSATLVAMASSQLVVSFTSLTTNVCTVNGNTVQYIAAGLCTVAADQAGNATYNPAPQVTQSVDVHKITQAIVFTSAAPTPGYINGTYAVAATGGASGNAMVITVAQPSVCTVNGTTVAFVGVGTCTVTANQAGNDLYYAAASVSQSVKVDYRYDGFLGGVKNGDVLNSAKAGQVIALEWRLTDANGAPITSLATPRINVEDLNCALGATTSQLTEQAAGSSGFQNLGNGYYQYNWKSPASYAKSCKTLGLDLGEGDGAHIARFAFTK